MADDTTRFMAMKGEGYYSKATTGARDVINSATPMVLDAIAAMDLSGEGPLTFTDMGCADGGTSLEMWWKALEAIRAKAPTRPIQMIYTDLPRNDFSQLFRTIHGQTDLQSYLPEIDNLYVFGSATSFHEPIVPPGALHLGFSATASHYIRETPCDIPDHVHMVGATGDVRAAYAAQGAADWELMLIARARELVPGGRLVLFNFGINEAGRYLGHTGGVSMFDTFAMLWRRLADQGVITAAEFRATNFPQHYRTVKEFAAPFHDPDSPVYKAGLQLDHIETRVVPCPYAADYNQAGGDPQAFARSYIPTLRSWSEPTFVSGLSKDRSPAEIAEIIDAFYQSYEDLVTEDPTGHGMDYVHCYLVASKNR